MRFWNGPIGARSTGPVVVVEVNVMQADSRPGDPIGGQDSSSPVGPWGSPPAGTDGGAGGGRVADPEEHRRVEAVKRLETKRGWTAAMLAYVVVNAFLVGIWAVTGRGYFWPGWVLGGWGMGMVLSFWDAFVRRPISEADIQAEIRRGRRSG